MAPAAAQGAARVWAGARRGEDAGRGSGPGWAPGRGRAHTQGVLDVDQPAVETEDLGNQDQLVRHRLVRALVSGQEGFALPPALLPLGDERACGTGPARSGLPPHPPAGRAQPGSCSSGITAACEPIRPSNPRLGIRHPGAQPWASASRRRAWVPADAQEAWLYAGLGHHRLFL